MLAWTCVHSRDASLLVAHAHTGLINPSNESPTIPPCTSMHTHHQPTQPSIHAHTHAHNIGRSSFARWGRSCRWRILGWKSWFVLEHIYVYVFMCVCV